MAETPQPGEATGIFKDRYLNPLDELDALRSEMFNTFTQITFFVDKGNLGNREDDFNQLVAQFRKLNSDMRDEINECR